MPERASEERNVSNEIPETAGNRRESTAAEPVKLDPAVEQPGTAPVESAPQAARVTGPAEVSEPVEIAEPAEATAPVEMTDPVEVTAARLAEPVQADVSEPVSLVEPAQRERADYVGATDAPVDANSAGTDAEPVAAAPVVGARPAAAYVAAEPSVQTVYVHAPVPPKRHSNRAMGSLIAVVATVVFAALYAGITILVMPLVALFLGSAAPEFLTFVGLPEFYVPVLVFLVSFVLLVLIVNRANWWAYVLGSFIVALLVYFVSIGILLLTSNVFGMTPERALVEFAVTAFSPLLIAAIVAREVPIWFGAAIAARGRRQKQRNIEEKAEFETELANNRSDISRGAIDYGTN
jgi:hypothetical protein